MSATGDSGEPPRSGGRAGRPAAGLRAGAGVDKPQQHESTAAGVLALLLTSVLDTAAVPVATALVDAFGSLTAVLAARHWQLAAVPGINEPAVRLIEATYAAQRWSAQEKLRERALLDNPGAVKRYVSVSLRGRMIEEAHGLFLDGRNYLIRDLRLSEGTVDRTPLYPREVVRQALLLDASAVILVHNHPSGDPTPSPADVHLTRQINDALRAVDIALHDHLIVGGNAVASFRANKLL